MFSNQPTNFHQRTSQPPQGILVMNNPLVKSLLLIVGVVLFMKYVAPKIPVVGTYLTIT